jgi:glycosyl transferase family 87
VVNARFATVQALSGWLLLACGAASVPLWVRALGIRASAMVQAAFALAMFATYPVMQAYYLRQLTLLLALLLAGAVAAVRSNRLRLAGILLGCATIKPQLVAPLVIVLGIWICGRWRQRQLLAWSFAGTMAVLVVAGEALLPGWIPRFVAASRAYQGYAGDPSLLQALLGWTGGLAASVLLLAGVIAFAWQNRRTGADTVVFALMVSTALTTDVLVLPKLAPYNQILLFPGLVLLWDRRAQVMAGGAAGRALYRATVACLGWQWLAAFLLAALSFVLPVAAMARFSGAPLYTVYPLPVVLGITLLIVGVKRLYEPRAKSREAARA